MFKWKDRKYVNARKKIFKNMDTNEILNLEVQDDEDNILEESDTPLTAHCLNMAQDELVDDMSKIYTGTNITAFTVKGRGRNNKVYGFCRQETRSGKNRIGFNDCNFTLNGVTITVKDGVFTLNGTCIADNTTFLDLESNMYKIDSIKPGNSLSAFYVSGSINGYLAYRLYDSNYAQNFSLELSELSSTKNYIKRITNANFIITPKNCNFRINKDTVFNNFSFKLMLTENEDDVYEAYGASPSPNFPAKVHCVGDDKNLFDINSHIELENAFRLYNTGTNSNNSNFYGLKIPVDPKEEYISSSDFSITGISNLCFFDKDMTYISGLPYNTSNRVFNTPEGCAYITLAIDKRFKWFKLQRGTVVTPWSPYMHGTVVNKSESRNYLKVSASSNTSNGITRIVNSDGSIKLTGTATERFAIIVSSKIDRLKSGNKYTVSFGTDNSVEKVLQYQGSKTSNLKDTYDKLFTVIPQYNNNNDYIHCYLQIEKGKTYNTTLHPMLLEGEYTATNLPDYVPHEEDTQVACLKEPLRGIGDVRDELDLSNKKITRGFTKIIFDGVNNKFTAKGDKFNTYSTSAISKIKKASNNNEVVKCLSNMFTAKSTNALYNSGEVGISINQYGQIWVGLDANSEIDTLDKLNAKLAETPLELVYPLATPIVESIDCSDKIAQYDGQTTIYNTDGAELECTLTNNRAIAQTNENLEKIEKSMPNPVKMITGEEFETNKYLNGYKVYGKMIDCGELPNATYKEVDTGLTNVNFVGMEGYAKKWDQVLPIPFVSNSAENSISVFINNNNIRISTAIDRSQYTGYVTVYYTKD